MWDGEVQDDNEVVMIAKTTQDRVPDLVENVKALHSYDCPCIVSLPVLDGNQAFLDYCVLKLQPLLEGHSLGIESHTSASLAHQSQDHPRSAFLASGWLLIRF